MSFYQWLRQLSGSRVQGSRAARRCPRWTPMLESLETRLAPATLTVNTIADNNTSDTVLSLREAILLVSNGGNASTALGRSLSGGESGQISGVYGSNDTIRFATTIDGQTISLSSTPINDATVAGPSAFLIKTPLTIDGQVGLTQGITIARSGSAANFRLFNVNVSGNLTLKGLTLRGGTAQGFDGGTTSLGGAGGGSAGLGGAIFNRGTLTLLNSTLTGNTAQGGAGGNYLYQAGIFGGGGGAGLGGTGGTSSGNGGSPGGGPNGGAGSTSTSTSGTMGGFGGGGGGGYSDGGSGSTGGMGGFGGGGGGAAFKGAGGGGGFGGGGGGSGAANSGKAAGANGYGGGGGGRGSYGGGGGGGGAGMGGAVFNEAGTVVITNSTFSGNSASAGLGGHNGAAGKGLGGGVFNRNGTITVTNSTFSGNTAANGGRGIFNLGDSVFPTTASTTATATIKNTIIGQSDTNGEDFTGKTNVNGTNTTSGSGNLIRTSSGFAGTIVSSADPQLSPLLNNGGPTPTMAPMGGSPAIDQGIKAGAPTTDQRGLNRDPDNAGTVDIGAYERRGFNVVVNTTADDTTTDSALSLREAINLANGVISFGALSTAEQAWVTDAASVANTITFASSLNGSTVTLSTVGDRRVGPAAFVVNYSIIAIDGVSGGSGITLSATGTTMRLFAVSSTGNLTLQNLTLSGGTAQGFVGGTSDGNVTGSGGGSAGLGGAIFNRGMLTILNSTLTGNIAQGGAGGTIDSRNHGSTGAGGAGLNAAGGAAHPGGYTGGGPNGGDIGTGGGFGGGGGGGAWPAGAGGGGGFGGGGGGGSFYGGAGGSGGFGGGGGGRAKSSGLLPGGAAGYGGGAGGYGFSASGAGGGGAGLGGAVFNEAGTVVITNSTLTGNVASGGAGGGGVFSFSAGVAGKGLGGGVFNRNGTITVTNSTFSGNMAADGGRGIFNLGDSIGTTTESTTATAIITNTILGQSDTDGEDFTGKTNDTGTNTTSGSGNLIRTSGGFAGTIVSSADPLLAALANNGGPTPTLGFASNSPALNAGTATGAPTTDQRGFLRKDGVDIGAFELLAPPNQRPTISNQTFSVAENRPDLSAVDAVFATDPDDGQELTYAITGGNTNNAFAIDPTTGALRVNNSAALDYETTPTFVLTVTVTDNGVPNLSASATITVNLTNVNETPFLNGQTFNLAENSAGGTQVGFVVGSDLDAGQQLTYSIIAGNTNGAFAIDPITGRLTVANSAALDYETTPSFTLTIQATDNGSPNRSTTAEVVINLLDVAEAATGTDVTSRIALTRGGYKYNRSTALWEQAITLKNSSTSSIAGTIQFALENLTPGVTLASSADYVVTSPGAGRYVVTIPMSKLAALAAGQRYQLNLLFSNPLNKTITYDWKVFTTTVS